MTDTSLPVSASQPQPASSPWIYSLSSGQTDAQLLHSDVPVLLDFWASWCAPCRAILPLLEKQVSELQGQVLLFKVDADQSPELLQRFAVHSLPAVLLLQKGKEVDRFQQTLSEPQIRAFIQPWLVVPDLRIRQVRDLLRQAEQAFATGQAEKAMRRLQQVYASTAGQEGMLAQVLADLLNAVLAGIRQQPMGSAVRRGLLQQAQQWLADAGFALLRDPRVQQAQARLALLEHEPHSDEIATLRQRLAHFSNASKDADQVGETALLLASALAAAADYCDALDVLMAFLQTSNPAASAAQRQRVQARLIEIIDILPDRVLANQYRRQLFALNVF